MALESLQPRGASRRWLKSLEPEDAARYCPEHANYIGYKGVFPCKDCEKESDD